MCSRFTWTFEWRGCPRPSRGLGIVDWALSRASQPSKKPWLGPNWRPPPWSGVLSCVGRQAVETVRCLLEGLDLPHPDTTNGTGRYAAPARPPLAPPQLIGSPMAVPLVVFGTGKGSRTTRRNTKKPNKTPLTGPVSGPDLMLSKRREHSY